jgi:hypothetical protein
LPAEAVANGPHAGFAITIDLSPASSSPASLSSSDLAPANHSPDACLRPDTPTQDANASGHEEAGPLSGDVSSPSFSSQSATVTEKVAEEVAAGAAVEKINGAGKIHFDSVESELEAAVLRHVSQLSAAPVIVDRPGGVVRSERELRIVLPNSGDAAADESAAVAVEFGILRGLLDLVDGAAREFSRARFIGVAPDSDGDGQSGSRGFWGALSGSRWWWPFGVVLMFLAGTAVLHSGAAARGDEAPNGSRGTGGGSSSLQLQTAIVRRSSIGESALAVMEIHRLKSVPLELRGSAAASELAAAPAQGQFATGQEFRISDGTNFLVVDPCKGQTKLFASISQTGNTQLVAGTASKKIYLCSVHVVVAAATNVAVVEGTGSVCATGTAGMSGFGGAAAATGWNFAANGGIALGNGDSSLGAEETAGDNLCVFNSGSGQVSGGISYVVQ